MVFLRVSNLSRLKLQTLCQLIQVFFMFIEPNLSGGRRGWIEVICGSMFSGKTEELIRRLKRVKIANQSLQIFKPLVDNRYASDAIVSHDESMLSSMAVGSSAEILEKGLGFDVVGIDEAQFFDAELPAVCDQLALAGTRVIVAGLDMDYRAQPFGQMPFLMARADFITKLHAICVVCGNLASFSYRKTGGEQLVLLGEKDHYEPRCRSCYHI